MSKSRKLFQVIDQTMRYNQFSRNNSLLPAYAKPLKNQEIRTVIHGIETGVPETQMSQRALFHKLMPDKRMNQQNLEKLGKVSNMFNNAKIERRHVAASFLSKSMPTMGEKMDAYVEEGSKLAVVTAKKALDNANVNASDIENIVFVSSTGTVSPGLDATIIRELGLSHGIRRANIGFVGCYGGLKGLSLADDYCISNPGKNTLLVCLELHSIHMDRAKAQNSNPSANLLRAIFGDGCVAVVLSGEAESNISGKWALHGRSSYLTENTTNIVKIVPDEIGFDWNITPELPKLVKGGVNQFIEDLLENQSIVKGDKVDWGIHPGGPAILKACESSLGLEKNELKESWDVLKNFGNMSSATIWFVLQQIMRKEGKNAQNLIALAFGPGVTMEGALFKKY